MKQNLDTVLCALESMGTIQIFLQECLPEYSHNMGEKIFCLDLFLFICLDLFSRRLSIG